MARKSRCPRPLGGLIHWRRSNFAGPFFSRVGDDCIKTVGNWVGPGKPGSGPMATALVVTDPTSATVHFSLCVSIGAATGIQYRINGGTWTQVSAFAKITDTAWDFTIGTTADGDLVEWRYIGGSGSILDCEEAEDIGDQGPLSYRIPEAAVEPVLHAFAPDGDGTMTAVLVGTGSLTIPRSTQVSWRDAGAPYRRYDPQSAGYDGGRKVTNLLSYSNDFALALWTVASATKEGVAPVPGPNGETAFQLAFGAASGARIGQNFDISDLDEGVPPLILSVWARMDSGTGKFRLRHTTTGTNDLDLTETWQRFTYCRETPSATEMRIHNGTDALARTVYICNAQVELADAYPDDVGSIENHYPASEYVDTPGTARITRVFAHENGNTIETGSVLKEARGTDFADTPKIWHAPAATNDAWPSRDCTLAPWTAQNATVSYDQVGLEGLPNTATRITTTGTQSLCGLQNNSFIPNANDGQGCIVVYTKHAVTNFFYLDITSMDASEGPRRVWFDINTGAVGITGAAYVAVEIIDMGAGVYKCIAETGILTGGNQRLLVYISDSDGGIEATDGATDILNVEWYEGTTIDDVRRLPPIFTIGAPTTRSTDQYSLDLANWSDTEGSAILDVDVDISTDLVGGFLKWNGTANRFELQDGTNTAFVASTPGARKVGFVWGGGTMRINADGVWGAETPYDGSFPVGAALDILGGANPPGGISDLKRWDTKDESLIDGEMP